MSSLEKNFTYKSQFIYEDNYTRNENQKKTFIESEISEYSSQEISINGNQGTSCNQKKEQNKLQGLYLRNKNNIQKLQKHQNQNEPNIIRSNYRKQSKKGTVLMKNFINTVEQAVKANNKKKKEKLVEQDLKVLSNIIDQLQNFNIQQNTEEQMQIKNPISSKIRRKSCYCYKCGDLTEKQLRFHNIQREQKKTIRKKAIKKLRKQVFNICTLCKHLLKRPQEQQLQDIVKNIKKYVIPNKPQIISSAEELYLSSVSFEQYKIEKKIKQIEQQRKVEEEIRKQNQIIDNASNLDENEKEELKKQQANNFNSSQTQNFSDLINKMLKDKMLKQRQSIKQIQLGKKKSIQAFAKSPQKPVIMDLLLSSKQSKSVKRFVQTSEKKKRQINLQDPITNYSPFEKQNQNTNEQMKLSQKSIDYSNYKQLLANTPQSQIQLETSINPSICKKILIYYDYDNLLLIFIGDIEEYDSSEEDNNEAKKSLKTDYLSPPNKHHSIFRKYSHNIDQQQQQSNTVSLNLNKTQQNIKSQEEIQNGGKSYQINQNTKNNGDNNNNDTINEIQSDNKSVKIYLQSSKKIKLKSRNLATRQSNSSNDYLPYLSTYSSVKQQNSQLMSPLFKQVPRQYNNVGRNSIQFPLKKQKSQNTSNNYYKQKSYNTNTNSNSNKNYIEFSETNRDRSNKNKESTNLISNYQIQIQNQEKEQKNPNRINNQYLQKAKLSIFSSQSQQKIQSNQDLDTINNINTGSNQTQKQYIQSHRNVQQSYKEYYDQYLENLRQQKVQKKFQNDTKSAQSKSPKKGRNSLNMIKIVNAKPRNSFNLTSKASESKKSIGNLDQLQQQFDVQSAKSMVKQQKLSESLYSFNKYLKKQKNTQNSNKDGQKTANVNKSKLKNYINDEQNNKIYQDYPNFQLKNFKSQR
ncbi:hypothetical protein PPERSA_04825 [Pseudocohnilembus persalinus]|uniref:Uncharacterized protein n=1 Tax=Pseudocohnilembus persalinus TaxID=266149 RepID=A0A0V0QJ74_PSEPJ|nr:hypothetical protein PPERSA_04825 [Pseudocohnilembus persalinus]|eukprot:KRX02203.1 hypothetical protein PPERSA_04825 [Pseudocohnilembus persalinus]